MKILLNFNTQNNKDINCLGGIETLNNNFYERIKKKYKNFIIDKKANKKFYDIIISSNDAKIFDKYSTKKKILWLHNKLQLEKAIRKKQLLPILKNKIYAVFVSKYLDNITSKFYNFKERVIIPNFLDKNFENIKTNYIRKPIIIWSVSRERGLKETLSIWCKYIHNKHPNAEFHIFGTKKYHKLNYNKNNIYFHGRVSKQTLIKYYKNSIASICLGFDETFCLNAIESMSCGVPVISFKKTALVSLIKNNKNGFKLDNFSQLGDKISKLILFSKLKRNKIIKSSQMYSKKFYFKNIEKQWIKLILK
jgi:glycosyltransferase involved in cell wall biosynthesis